MKHIEGKQNKYILSFDTNHYMDILYYSNLCVHSQKVIEFIVKHQLSNQLSCICVDKRKRDVNNNQTVVVLENGQQVTLPPNLQSIPAILCVKKNYTLVLGKDPILAYLQEKFGTQYANAAFDHPGKQRMQEREPVGVTLTGLTLNSNILSESFTSYHLGPDDLSTKSTSQNRPLHHYTSVNQDFKINTPEDNYRPDKVSSNVTIDVLQQQRNHEIPAVQVAPPSGIYGEGASVSTQNMNINTTNLVGSTTSLPNPTDLRSNGFVSNRNMKSHAGGM
jgi:hypothetical protein